MKKIVLMITSLILILFCLTGCQMKEEKQKNIRLVTSFYPMYNITQNVAKGIDGVVVENMASQSVGCLHDYTLTTADLMKIEEADIFIINGLGIENFTNKIVENYSKISIIDSSVGMENKEENAHIWLDINKYSKQVENIANGLAEKDTEHADEYIKNGQDYKQQLEGLKNTIEENTKQTKKCLSFSESLEYLANTMNLEIETIETDHEQNGLSAEMLSKAIEYVKENQIKNILIDKNTADNNAQIVASETGATIYVLDSGLSGSGELDSYFVMMKENLEQVKRME